MKAEGIKDINAIRDKTQHNTDRHYKLGDILRWAPTNARWEQVEAKGLAVVIKADGPFFSLFWLGDESTSDHDARWGGFVLQDLAPMPEVAVHVATMRQRDNI